MMFGLPGIFFSEVLDVNRMELDITGPKAAAKKAVDRDLVTKSLASFGGGVSNNFGSQSLSAAGRCLEVACYKGQEI